MDELTEYLSSTADDGLWEQIQAEARHEAEREPMLVSFLYAAVLRHATLEAGLSVILANKLQTPEVPAILLRDLIHEAFAADPSIRASIRADLLAARTRDPAARGYAQPFLYYKGFHALQAYRVAHWLWNSERCGLAAHLQNRISEAFGVDVHPAARIGSRHHHRSWHERRHRRDGRGGRQRFDPARSHVGRHRQRARRPAPQSPPRRAARRGREDSGQHRDRPGRQSSRRQRRARDVPPRTTVAGIPARVVGKCTVAEPALEMDATFPFPSTPARESKPDRARVARRGASSDGRGSYISAEPRPIRGAQ